MKRNKDFIYGRNPVLEMLQDGQRFERILLQKGVHPGFASEVRQLAGTMDIPVQIVPRPKLERLTKGNHQGIVAFKSWVEYLKLEDVVPFAYEQGEVPLILILDRVSDVRNIGAIARSAEVFGATAIVLPGKGSALLNADAVKTSAGALTRLPVCRENSLATAMRQMQLQGIRVGSAVEGAETELSDVDLSLPVAVILGSEGSGIHPSLLKESDFTFGIPQVGQSNSLNVSVAAGIILYEVIRQRKNKV